MHGVAADAIRVGMSVQVRFVEIEAGYVLPVFAPV
jgi:hypothetical protein